jgi:hypothetical protein
MTTSAYVKILRERLTNSIALPFHNILTQEIMQNTLNELNIKYRKRLYDPIITLWTFIWQVLDPDKSCSNAVSHILSLLADTSLKLPSDDTGAYCKARKRLDLRFIIYLIGHVGQMLHSRLSDDFLWCNRRVFLVDGSSLSTYDSVENKQEFTQPKNQHDYYGFPVARIVGIFCLATGAVIEAVIDSFQTAEIKLFRSLYSHLKTGDIALGDRIFGSYADISLLSQRGVDSVFRMNALRKPDFTKGKRLGQYDHLVYWKKPKQGTIRLEQELYDKLPDTMLLREIRFFINIKGYRTQVVTLVTTLLDHEVYTYEHLSQLYGFRWQVEIDFRHLKTTMQMEHIPTKTPDMVKKEFYVHLLAYNLIRGTLLESGIKHEFHPLRLSFKGAMQHILNFIPILAIIGEHRYFIYTTMLTIISHGKIPDRPFRVEPRMVRNRTKVFPHLKRPRQEVRQKLVA